MSKKVKLTVEMEVTIPQALALQAMFNYWNDLSILGSSREVGFYVDGDGDFHPNCNISFLGDAKVPKLTKELAKIAVVSEDGSGNRIYDYDFIANKINK